MGDEDCCGCVYGAEFIDDGIPHRYIAFMCEPCKRASEKMIDFLVVARAERMPSQGDA